MDEYEHQSLTAPQPLKKTLCERARGHSNLDARYRGYVARKRVQCTSRCLLPDRLLTLRSGLLEFVSDYEHTVSAVIWATAAMPTSGATTQATAATLMTGEGSAGAGPSRSSMAMGASAGLDAVTEELWALGPQQQ